MSDPISVGGQAVLEGVMMRAPRSMTVAVRRQSGEIVVKKDHLNLLTDRYKFLKWPILRGTVSLFSALALGMKALSFSANAAMEDEMAKDAAEKAEAGQAAAPIKPEKPMSDLAMAGTMALSMALGLGLFFYLPLLLTQFMFGQASSLMFNLVDGVIRIGIFILYIFAISRMKDIRRVFEYHGAEHKAIYAYESGQELTVENAQKFTTLHPRCGTSFLLIVMVFSILVFSVVPKTSPFYIKALSRFVFIPLIAGISFEFIKYSAKKKCNPIMAAMIKPGLWLQKLTTREPSDDQVEVAIQALKEAVAMEGEGVTAPEVKVCLAS